jgi:uncharacterized membrane protein
MELGLTATFLLLGLIWVSTVSLAYRSAKLSTEQSQHQTAYFALMIMLILLAVILVADKWYVDLV